MDRVSVDLDTPPGLVIPTLVVTPAMADLNISASLTGNWVRTWPTRGSGRARRCQGDRSRGVIEPDDPDGPARSTAFG